MVAIHNAPNRTIVELKWDTNERRVINCDSQPHHSGIEIGLYSFCAGELLTPNRTIVELK